MGVYLEDLTYKEILPILARTGKLIDTRKIIEIDKETIDIAQDIMDGCKELKERVDKGIVRCGECKHRDSEFCQIRESMYGIKDNDFCSYGERRNDGTTN